MNFHVLTLFPEMVMQGLNTSILGRAMENGQISVEAVNIRDYTLDKHGRVDDYPYGGGAGMLMQAQPVYDAYRAVTERIEETHAEPDANGCTRKIRTVYLTPQGTAFSQEMAEELAKEEDLIFLCGHYEGIDERVLEEIVTDYVSIGDYVLTGGELPAMVMIDAIARLVPGVLNNDMSAETESFHGSLLEYPQYSRPVSWQGKEVPKVLLSGDHKKIREWRLEQSEKRTKERRPDLYKQYEKMQGCLDRLMKNKLLHMDMIELIRRGQAQLVYNGKEGVLLRDKVSGGYMITAVSKEAGAHILETSLEEIQSRNQWQKEFLFVSHQEFMNDVLAEKLDMEVFMCCRQAVYTRKEPLPPVNADVEIRYLNAEHLDAVCAHYHVVDRQCLAGRISHGCMFGAFKGDTLTGFIGVHEEGGIGMLEVLPEYRGQKIGSALETYVINRFLEQGLTPYGQIETENAVSMKLQEKLNHYFAKGNIYWLQNKDNS